MCLDNGVLLKLTFLGHLWPSHTYRFTGVFLLETKNYDLMLQMCFCLLLAPPIVCIFGLPATLHVLNMACAIHHILSDSIEFKDDVRQCRREDNILSWPALYYVEQTLNSGAWIDGGISKEQVEVKRIESEDCLSQIMNDIHDLHVQIKQLNL